jgi:hypothetical protein
MVLIKIPASRFLSLALELVGFTVTKTDSSAVAPLAVQGYPVWAGSEAARLLKIDVDNGRHLTMKPRELYALDDRPEYRIWPLKVFRKHIHQEVRSRKTQAYWLHRAPGASASEPWPLIDSL